MLRFRWHLALLGVVASSCGGYNHDGAEIILFATIGDRPFRDSIHIVETDGSRFQTLLSPTPGRSYLLASANSQQGPTVVTVHEAEGHGEINDHIYVVFLGQANWQRLVNQAGFEGGGMISPDDSRVVFEFVPAGRPLRYRLWEADLRTGQSRELMPGSDMSFWDAYPVWRPDGNEISFIRVRPTTAGLETTLIRFGLRGGISDVLIGPPESPAAASYSPDGQKMAAWTRNGLEIIATSDKARRVILPRSALPDREFHAGGLSWARSLNKIAFAVYNKKMDRHELWTVNSDGKNPKSIYTIKGAGIAGVSFIRKE